MPVLWGECPGGLDGVMERPRMHSGTLWPADTVSFFWKPRWLDQRGAEVGAALWPCPHSTSGLQAHLATLTWSPQAWEAPRWVEGLACKGWILRKRDFSFWHCP